MFGLLMVGNSLILRPWLQTEHDSRISTKDGPLHELFHPLEIVALFGQQSGIVGRPPGLIVFGVALGVAALSALPFAGSWNDGSRLATVESLVDHNTWKIDDSIFVNPPPPESQTPGPYQAAHLMKHGTMDKILIGGSFYSDKPPVMALIMAGIYKTIQVVTGLKAAKDPALFCWVMTLITSGLAYAASVTAINRMAGNQRLAMAPHTLLVCSFAVATMALPYSRHVNSHLVVLGVCCWLVVTITNTRSSELRKSLISGALAGLLYALDPAIGPVLVVTLVVLLAIQYRSARPVIVMLLSAAPWFALHHWLNYKIGGGFWPANSNPSAFAWPGSPFSAENMTGIFQERDPLQTLTYAMGLLFDRAGFLNYNLPVYLVLPGVVILLKMRPRETPEVLWSAAFSIGVWMIFTLFSNNGGGESRSVRWFLPLLAPAFYLLSLLLRDTPQLFTSLAILTTGGSLVGALMWWQGPWSRKMLPGFWVILTLTLLSWLAHILRNRGTLIPGSHKSEMSKSGQTGDGI